MPRPVRRTHRRARRHQTTQRVAHSRASATVESLLHVRNSPDGSGYKEHSERFVVTASSRTSKTTRQRLSSGLGRKSRSLSELVFSPIVGLSLYLLRRCG